MVIDGKEEDSELGNAFSQLRVSSGSNIDALREKEAAFLFLRSNACNAISLARRPRLVAPQQCVGCGAVHAT